MGRKLNDTWRGMDMKQRSIFTIGAAFMAVAFVFSGCAKPNERLYLYNWNYYTPPSVIQKFEQEFGVRVVQDEFDSNESMFAKLRSGGSGYDIVVPSADYVSIMIQLGMLERIDHSKIKNLANIDPVLLQKAVYDPRMEFSVPYYWGASGVAVNTARVPNFEESMSIFADPSLRERMTMLDDLREVLGFALNYLGYSVNSSNPREIEAARDLINTQWKPNLVKFDADAFGKGFANEEFWVVQGYAETVFQEIAGNDQMMRNTRFFIPKEGGPAYIDSMVIPKGARNIELAHTFIDFIHRPEIYAEFCDTFGFPATANVPARNFLRGPSWFAPNGVPRTEPWYTVEDLARTELKEDVGEALVLFTTAWFDSIRIGK